MRTERNEVRREIELDVGVDDVWRALVDDDERRRWMGGDTVVDVQPGGRGHITGDDGVRREVLIDEVEPGRRLSFDWWNDDEVPSRVEFVISPTEQGVRLTVTERALVPSARACAAVSMCRTLAGHLAGHALV